MDIDELFRSSEHKPPRPPGAGTPARAPGAMADAALLSVDDLFTPIARPALRPNAGGAGGSGAGGSGAAGGGHKRSFDPVEESDPDSGDDDTVRKCSATCERGCPCWA